MNDNKVSDLMRVFDGFPPAGSGMGKRRKLARVVAMEPSAT
jgi:hypothetical protein